MMQYVWTQRSLSTAEYKGKAFAVHLEHTVGSYEPCIRLRLTRLQGWAVQCSSSRLKVPQPLLDPVQLGLNYTLESALHTHLSNGMKQSAAQFSYSDVLP